MYLKCYLQDITTQHKNLYVKMKINALVISEVKTIKNELKGRTCNFYIKNMCLHSNTWCSLLTL